MRLEDMPDTVKGKLLEANALMEAAENMRHNAWQLRRAALEQRREELRDAE